MKFNSTKETAEKDIADFKEKLLPKGLEGILVVEMASFYDKTPSHGELLLSGLIDSAFGPVVCFGFGGTTVEQLKKFMPESVLFIPCLVDLQKSVEWRRRIEELPVSQYLLGKMRGIPKQVGSLSDIIAPIEALQKLLLSYIANDEVIEELEINPCVVEKGTGKIIALDGVVKIGKNKFPNKEYAS